MEVTRKTLVLKLGDCQQPLRSQYETCTSYPIIDRPFS